MTSEPLPYRARKWVLQQFSSMFDRSDQHDRLQNLDWDVLVVMDACRYDVLREVTNWPVERCRSPASATDQWLDVCQRTGVLSGSHIATGNVQYEDRDIGAASIEHCWRDHWDDSLGNVTPEPVLDAADDFLAEGETPVVAHVLPPHAPYVARVDEAWHPSFPDLDIWRRNPTRDDNKLSPQVAMASGRVDMDRAVNGYRASVESTWETVTSYLDDWLVDGRTVVVTADHGESFGRLRDWGLYGHPNRVHLRPLVEVPWVVFQPPRTTPGDAANTAQEKLEALGYVEQH